MTKAKAPKPIVKVKPKLTYVGIKMPTELVDRLKEAAKTKGITLTEFARNLFLKWEARQIDKLK